MYPLTLQLSDAHYKKSVHTCSLEYEMLLIDPHLV